MSKWWATPETTPCFTEPETQFVRFVAENYYKFPFHSDVRFLELGSGSGGDLKFLERHGFYAIGIDSNPLAYANWHCDFSEFPWDRYEEYFHCIYDLNVLCCVKEPPYQPISKALRPGGKFYSIMPATGTLANLSHLEYVRLSTPFTIRTALQDVFSKIDIGPYNYWHRKRNHINWVVEADK